MRKNQYQIREKEKQHHLEIVVKDIINSARQVKYITNHKSESLLQKPLIQHATQLTKERLSQLKKQLAVSHTPYTNERFCEFYTPIQQLEQHIDPRLQKLLERSKKYKKDQEWQLPKAGVLDLQQMQSFRQLFQAEQVLHKKSKYEALIERLKEQMPPGEELDLRKALISLTPQFEQYKTLKQKYIKEMANQKPDENQVKAIDTILQKLGLSSKKVKRRQFMQQILKTEQCQNMEQIKQLDVKHQRLKTLEASISCQSASQRQFSSLLEQQQIRGIISYPFQVKKLMNIKQRVKDFYEDVVCFQQNNQIQGMEDDTKQFMLNIKEEMNTWREELQTQTERMEQQLINDIKSEVMDQQNVIVQIK